MKCTKTSHRSRKIKKKSYKHPITKFMLQALSTFNETENRIAESLKHFKKLDAGIAQINEMQWWYRKIDENQLSIHLLSVYQLANNYIDEMLRHYRNILDVHYNTGKFYDFITPAHVEDILTTSRKNLPSNLQILSHPMVNSDVEHSKNFIHLYGYFIIAEVKNYLMIKVTPIPLTFEKRNYWILDLTTDIIAIDYDNQHYFQLSEENFKQCQEVRNNQYICNPPVIKDISSSPNCVIDEIYNRTDNVTCAILQKEVKTLLWKPLYTSNSWLFISPGVTKVAVTCNGYREDAKLNQTGIIAISQNCIITTKTIILTPRRNENIPVLAGFARPVVANVTTSTKPFFRSVPVDNDIITDHDDLKSLIEEEHNIQEELQSSHWKRIHHRSISTSIIATAVTLLIAAMTIYGIRWLRKHLNQRKSIHPKHQHDYACYTQFSYIIPVQLVCLSRVHDFRLVRSFRDIL